MSTRDILARNALFSELTEDGLNRLIDVGRVEYWSQGAVVLEQGAVGPRMMVILEGEVEVLRRDPSGVERAIATLGEGEILGELSLLLDLPRTASVVARRDLRVFSMDRTAFNQMVADNDPAALRFGLELSRVLAARMIRLNETVVDLLMAAEGAEPLHERFGQRRQEIFRLWEY